ncbi:uncharacterized protein LOC142358108, partial [Convolutriloba macropyga]|uniref:uncharacterized protein LOC142358108 n=1 Tax=Convolutriloba macropyga TaxID=536237 RepID=UPI003F520366
FGETPVWQHQREAFICDHPADQPVVFLFVTVNQTWDTFTRTWHRSTIEEQHDIVDVSFQNNIHTWVHCNFYNKLRLSRVEYYKNHLPERVQISVTTSTAENVLKGQTRINLEWRESFINRIDKFRDSNIWSFALLLCSVILGLERCYAIMNRAKAQRRKQRKKSLASALNSIHANIDA